ncbi:DUF547 domain-containing protein [Cupriavidus sp. CP313]
MRSDRRRVLRAGVGAAAIAVAPRTFAEAFDPAHGAWTTLLNKYVVLLRGGQASQVNYAGFASERVALRDYLDNLSAVTGKAFARFGKAQQQAFLINAYNAFTIELVLTRYPNLKSIKELGGLLSSAWKPTWIPLLGAMVSLDNIEHDMLRARGRYDDWRVHFAVNCASVGCPMLREEAYVAERLDAQLEQQTMRYMSDRTRNRFDGHRGRIALSKLFDWYGEDFRLGFGGIGSLSGFAARYAALLTDSPADRMRIRSESLPIAFLDYDWALNDIQ